MNRAIAGVAIWFGVLAAGTARADDNSSELQIANGSFAGGTGYIRVDPPAGGADSVSHFSNVLYLNRCAGGCNVSYGNDNSSNDTSSVGAGYLAEFRWDDATWNDTVDCVREIFAPFNITVTTDDPGSAEHMEAMVGGHACDLDGGPSWNVQCGFILGVAPFECDYAYIDRSVSFTFANDNSYGSGTHAQNVNSLCSTIGQEVAHTWGLDHELLSSDPMTYLPYNGRRHYQDQSVNCGEYNGQPHGCGAAVGCSGTPSQQNSVEKILERFGPSNPTPPHMTITSPTDGAEVQPGFSVHAEADEDLTKAELRVDNVLVGTDTSAPYRFDTSADLAQGSHHLEVRGYDAQNTPGSAEIDVTIGDMCHGDGDCADQGDNNICVGGQCVPGSGTPGGLGEPCDSDDACFSGLCLTSGDDRRCVESCDLAANDCPDGFDCLNFDGGGVCWPASGDGGGGGCAASDNGGAGWPIGLGLAFAFAVTRRRRRRP